jgi:membrane associated rhomboid family serine protease
VIPLRDDIPSRRLPVVTWLLIAANAAVFLHELSLGPAARSFILGLGIVPARFAIDPGAGAQTLFSSMFIHGGWGHLLGNMLFLWIFGDNVEDRMGHVPFLFFYLAAGLAAGLTHIYTQVGSLVPTVGASGAVAGVLGAYFVLYPRARVLTLLPTFPMAVAEIPAVFFLGIWFVFQIFSGALQLSIARGAGGVAFLAHVGGFLAGLAFGALAARATGRPTRAGG